MTPIYKITKAAEQITNKEQNAAEGEAEDTEKTENADKTEAAAKTDGGEKTGEESGSESDKEEKNRYR